MRHSAVHAEPHGSVLLLTLHGPGGFPRLTRLAIGQLAQAIVAAQSSAAVDAIVITGTEKCFAAGADLSEVSLLTPLEALRFSALGQNLMRTIERSAKPVIAAVRGHCLGGGFDLALACHLRIVAADAVFRHPGASLGILTGWGGTQRLPRIATSPGRGRAIEALLSGKTISASDAFHCGLVQRLCNPTETLSTALEIARAAGPNNSRLASA